METNNNNDYKIKSLEQDSKTSKTLAVLAGATASLGALVTIGNLASGNGIIGLQNSGTTIAMAGYVIGYLNKVRLNNKEIIRLEEQQLDTPEDRLAELKNKVTQTKNSLAMSTTAAVGFGVSTIANIALMTEGYYSAIGAMILTGTISILDGLMSFQHAKKIKETKARVSLLEDLDEISKKPIPELVESPEDEKRLLK